MSQPEQLRNEISKNEELKTSAQAEHASLVSKLAQHPADKEIMTQLDDVEAEIKGYDRAITRLHAAVVEVARRNSKEGRKERFELLKVQRERIARSNSDTEALAKKLEKAFDAIGPLLAQWQLHTEDRSADARSIMSATIGTGANALKGEANTSNALTQLETGQIVEALARLVVGTGLARTGPRLDPFVTVAEPSTISRKMTLSEAVSDANKKLLHVIDERIERGATLLLEAGDE